MNISILKHVFAVCIVLSVLFWSSRSSAQCCGVDPSGGKEESAEEGTPLETKLPMLLDLGAKKCIPCKMMAPILEELEKEYEGIFTVKFIDVWQKENAAEAGKYKIESIPTQIFFDENGKELWRHTGFISKADILKKWKALGCDFEWMKKKSEEKK
ncbi:MAG: hypothetical protein A2020_10280 [Lentisphaerae bacterium GWF2_45_14]|nr:MAG: hypothetical protein A2020_10280 [Lentisphaerae bacterium GWF2_45_14]